MRERTSSPIEPTTLDALRALREAPAWHDEPPAAWLSETLGCTRRAARTVLEGIDLLIEPAPSALGLLDETWLYRTRAGPVAGESVLAWTALEGSHALVRTLARDAVDRERVMRALHARLGERPMLQLERGRGAPPARKLSAADAELLARLCGAPWPTLDTRAERERARALTEEGRLAVSAWPRAGDARHVLVALHPSSTAAASRALDAVRAAFATHVPSEGEARHADGFALDDDVGAAREVPGVASVEVRRVLSRWRDDAAWSALLTDAARRAGG